MENTKVSRFFTIDKNVKVFFQNIILVKHRAWCANLTQFKGKFLRHVAADVTIAHASLMRPGIFIVPQVKGECRTFFVFVRLK